MVASCSAESFRCRGEWYVARFDRPASRNGGGEAMIKAPTGRMHLTDRSPSLPPEGGPAMTATDETTGVSPDLLFQIASGFMAAKHLFIANEVGLFAHLADGPAT